MKDENVKLKLTIPIPINKPDRNGNVYTEEAVENAICNLHKNIPIIYRKSDGYDTVIGSTTGGAHIVTWDFENQICNLTVDGVAFNSGVECIINEIQNGEVKDFRIVGVGLGKEVN